MRNGNGAVTGPRQLRPLRREGMLFPPAKNIWGWRERPKKKRRQENHPLRRIFLSCCVCVHAAFISHFTFHISHSKRKRYDVAIHHHRPVIQQCHPPPRKRPRSAYRTRSRNSPPPIRVSGQGVLERGLSYVRTLPACLLPPALHALAACRC